MRPDLLLGRGVTAPLQEALTIGGESPNGNGTPLPWGPPAAAATESQIPAYPRGVGGLGRRDQNEEPTRPVQPVQDSRAMGR